MKRIVLTCLLIIGCILWYLYVWIPSPEEKKALQQNTVAESSPPRFLQKEKTELVSQGDIQDATRVATSFIQNYVPFRADNPQENEQRIKPYLHPDFKNNDPRNEPNRAGIKLQSDELVKINKVSSEPYGDQVQTDVSVTVRETVQVGNQTQSTEFPITYLVTLEKNDSHWLVKRVEIDAAHD
jgi:hypothetical protein